MSCLPSLVGKAMSEIMAHVPPGYFLSQDPFYVGIMKGVGRIYLQSVIDTYSRIGFGKFYTSKLPVTSADVLNDRALPLFEDQEVSVLRILTDQRFHQTIPNEFLRVAVRKTLYADEVRWHDNDGEHHGGEGAG